LTPLDGGPPGLRGSRAEDGVGTGNEVERVGHDGPDRPPVAEGSAQFVLADPARADVPRLPVAEAHQVAGTARAQHRRQALDIPGAVDVVEDVEQTAVDDRVEGQAQIGQAQRIADLEAGLDAARGRLLEGPLDGHR
jgi:hypothetical protein